MPVQKAPKLPATNPDRIFNEAPPCSEALTTSLTWADFGEVKIFVTSGITAAPKVPQLIINESIHHRFEFPPISGIKI